MGSEIKHTPGLWRAVPLGCGVGIYAEDGHCVAYTNNGSKSRAAVRNGTHGDDEQKANGELIAISPVLLSFVERVYGVGTRTKEGYNAGVAAEILASLIEEANEILQSSRNAKDSSLKKTTADTEERLGALARSDAPLGEQGVLDCPNCPNQGWYVNSQGDQEQCQFCYCEPDSRFNYEASMRSDMKRKDMSTIKAYYTDRRGAGCMRVIRDAAEAEKILTGGYGAQEVRLENENGVVVGRRHRADHMDDKRMKWLWYFEKDAFSLSPSGPQEA